MSVSSFKDNAVNGGETCERNLRGSTRVNAGTILPDIPHMNRQPDHRLLYLGVVDATSMTAAGCRVKVVSPEPAFCPKVTATNASTAAKRICHALHRPDCLSCPINVMIFYLVYTGPLPGSGNKPKPGYARNIRDQIHPQLERLWQTHSALDRLRHSAWVPDNPGDWLTSPRSPFQSDTGHTYLQHEDRYTNLCENLVRGEKTYKPLVRKSLDLNCSLDILLLRHEDPGELILQGGDLDNRIKTLFDGLRMPDIDVEKKYPQAQNPTYCLLESDTLISGIKVSTGRLLTPQSDQLNEVQLIIEVTVRVLKVGDWNLCLVGA